MNEHHQSKVTLYGFECCMGFVVENDSDQKYSGVCVYALSCFSWRTAISNKREPLLKRDPSSELHLGMHKIVASNIPTKYKLTFLSLLH